MIRKLFLSLFTILLLLSLISLGISWDLSSSLKYSNIQNQIPSLSQVIIQQFDLPKQVTNDSALISSFVKNWYYTNYNCSYWKCFSNYSATFLVSEKSDNYWSNLTYIFLAISALIVAIVLLLVEKKYNLFFIVGSLIIIASLPLLLINQILSKFSNSLVSSVGSLFFSQSHYEFTRMIIIGAVIFMIGLAIKLFKKDFKVHETSSKQDGSNITIKKLDVKNKEK